MFSSGISLHFQMKKEHIQVVTKAMSYIIQELDVDLLFLSQFQSQNILDEHSIDEIWVGEIPKWLQVVINPGLENWFLIPFTYLW